MNAMVESLPESRALPAPVSEATTLLQIIQRAANNEGTDLEKMQALLNMHNELRRQQADTAFNAAMSATQAEMGRIATDAENPQSRSRYATYGQLDRHLRPIYTKHGFSLSFGTAESPIPEYVRVLCTVAHSAGASRPYQIDMPADGKGAKGGDVMTKTHATGAATSYGMRYLLKMIFNVAIGEDDTDGNEPVELVDEKQVADLKALATEVSANMFLFLKHLKIKALSELPAARYDEAVNELKRKRGQAK